MAMIAVLIGALIPTFLVSRLLLWVLRSWNAGVRRFAVAHAGSWLICGFLGGMGMADGGAFATQAIAIYGLPQAFWLVMDLVRHKRRASETKLS